MTTSSTQPPAPDAGSAAGPDPLGPLLLGQLTWHWENQLRPRLDGLTDQEYQWEPVGGMWGVRPAGASPIGMGTGAFRADYVFPEPTPAPVTTIAWRLSHIVVGIFGERNHRYFGGPEITYLTYDYPADAATALADLDDGYRRWVAGVGALSETDLAQRCREPGFETDSMAALVVHINREAIHHGAEIALLRDLYTWRDAPR